MIDFDNINDKKINEAVNIVNCISNGFVLDSKRICMFYTLSIFSEFKDYMNINESNTIKINNTIEEEDIIDLYNTIQLYYD